MDNPFAMPGNHAEFTNGTKLTQHQLHTSDSSITAALIFSMEGVPSASEYKAMLQQPYLGFPPNPKHEFPKLGYNNVQFPCKGDDCLRELSLTLFAFRLELSSVDRCIFVAGIDKMCKVGVRLIGQKLNKPTNTEPKTFKFDSDSIHQLNLLILSQRCTFCRFVVFSLFLLSSSPPHHHPTRPKKQIGAEKAARMEKRVKSQVKRQVSVVCDL